MNELRISQWNTTVAQAEREIQNVLSNLRSERALVVAWVDDRVYIVEGLKIENVEGGRQLCGLPLFHSRLIGFVRSNRDRRARNTKRIRTVDLTHAIIHDIIAGETIYDGSQCPFDEPF